MGRRSRSAICFTSLAADCGETNGSELRNEEVVLSRRRQPCSASCGESDLCVHVCRCKRKWQYVWLAHSFNP